MSETTQDTKKTQSYTFLVAAAKKRSLTQEERENIADILERIIECYEDSEEDALAWHFDYDPDGVSIHIYDEEKFG